MILSPISELSIHGVYDRGVANQERIVIQSNQALNLGQYGVMLGYRTVDGLANPYHDHLFWFGDGVVQHGDWIFLYTGKGVPVINDVTGQNQKIYTLHWGKGTTIFAHSEVVPVLFRVDAVQVAMPPLNLPQGQI